jgi:prefoldin subunit 5
MIENSQPETFREKEQLKISYGQFGREEATKSNAAPEALKGSLPILYNKIVEDAKLDKESIQQQIKVLENSLVEIEGQKDNLLAKKSSIEDDITNCEKQIDDIEKNKAGNGDIIPLVIASFITLLLTFYLWAFYAASGYAALNGVKEGKSGFAGIFAALSDAFNKGGFVVVITVLFPIIFLSLGFLIHDALEKKKYGFIVVLLLFTFCFDAIIGYQISRHIYINSYNAGETEIQWQNGFIFSDVNFYLVVASGFVCYVMWGFLLHYALSKQRELQTPNRIKKLKSRIGELKSEVLQITASIKSCDNKIQKTQKELSDFKNGKVIININKLRANIGYFMNGWVAYIAFRHPDDDDKAKILIKEAIEIKETWLNEKIETLEK